MTCDHHWHMTNEYSNSAGTYRNLHCCRCGEVRLEHTPPQVAGSPTWVKPDTCGPYNPDRKTFYAD